MYVMSDMVGKTVTVTVKSEGKQFSGTLERVGGSEYRVEDRQRGLVARFYKSNVDEVIPAVPGVFDAKIVVHMVHNVQRSR